MYLQILPSDLVSEIYLFIPIKTLGLCNKEKQMCSQGDCNNNGHPSNRYVIPDPENPIFNDPKYAPQRNTITI